MKKLLILLLSVVSLTAMSQNQKIALLEPRAGEGSTAISGMEKAMVRGELRKAIVNHTGFEAFTRADIDQLMKEQDFQRTGNVSEADIHRMGEMSGADYLCISTLNKSEAEFYLEAYLINVETGAISNPASQYGELINGKLANMLPVCQALALELLGTNAPIAKPVITDNSEKQTESTPRIATTKNVPKTQDAAPQNSVQTAGGIGEIMSFSDGTSGVVFYKDNNGHGLVVSLEETTAKWDVAKGKNITDISDIPNGGTAIPNISTIGEGMINTEAILHQLPSAQCPAASWCVSLGKGWYLPTASELSYLLIIANAGQGMMGPISIALQTNGGTAINSGWYWTSSEVDRNEVVNLSSKGSYATEKKGEANSVRAIRAF